MPVECFSILHLLWSLFYITLHGDYENRAHTQRTLRGNTSEARSGPLFVTQHWKECLVYCVSCGHYSTSLYMGTMKTERTLKERFRGTPQKHVLALSLSRNTEKSVKCTASLLVTILHHSTWGLLKPGEARSDPLFVTQHWKECSGSCQCMLVIK